MDKKNYDLLYSKVQLFEILFNAKAYILTSLEPGQNGSLWLTGVIKDEEGSENHYSIHSHV